MNRQILITALFFAFLMLLWVGYEMGGSMGWGIVFLSVLSGTVCVSAICMLMWRQVRKEVDRQLTRMEEQMERWATTQSEWMATQSEWMSGQLERHGRQCPVRKEHLLATSMPADEPVSHSDTFRRAFQMEHPNFLFALRERVPNITPSEEMFSMLVKMKLSNQEIADKLSISVRSLHTTRYRLKRKLPLGEGESMDEWIQAIE